MNQLVYYSMEVTEEFYRIYRNGIFMGYTLTWADANALIEVMKQGE